MATVCQIRTKVNRVIDTMETWLSDRTAFLHSYEDILAARTGKKPSEFGIKYTVDRVIGMARNLFESDRDTHAYPLWEALEKAAVRNGMTGQEFSTGVGTYLKAENAIERIKTMIWYRGKKKKQIFTQRSDSVRPYQKGSGDFQTGMDVMDEIRDAKNKLFEQFYTLSEAEQQDYADYIMKLSEYLFDPANEQKFFKEGWKDKVEYEGMTISTAEDMLENMNPQFKQFYDDNVEKFDAIRETMNQRRRESGRIGPAGELERQMYNWKYYVPFKGSTTKNVEEFFDDLDIYRSTGYLNDPGEDRMKGRTSESNDPLHQLVLDLYRSGQTLVDSTVEKKLFEIAVEYAGVSDIKIKDPLNITGIKKLKSGKYIQDRNVGRKANTIIVHQGDYVQVLEIENRELFEGIKSQWTRSNPHFGAIYKWTMRPIAALKTKYNLPWVVYTNFIREFRQQLIFGALDLGQGADGKFSFDLSRAYMKNVLAFKGFGEAVRYSMRDRLGRKELEAKGSTYAKWANKFAENGGEAPFFQSLNLETVREQMEEMYATTFGSNESNKNKLLARAKKVNDFYSNVVDGIDVSTRVALFKAIVESGKMNEADAAIYVKNIMNFNYKGRYGDFLKSAFMFFGPSSAGVFRMLRTMTRGNVAQKWAIMGWYSASVGMAYMLANEFAGEDEDGEDKLKKVDDYTVIKNSVIPVADDDGVFNLLPRSIGLETLISAPGILAARYMLGHTTETEALTTMARTIVDNASFITPGDVGDAPTPGSYLNAMATSISPSQIRPLVEIAVNQSSMGLPIYDPFASDLKPQYMQSKASTDEIYVELSRKFFGGLGVDISPESLKYASLQYLGVIGSSVNRIATMYEKQVRGDPITATDIPFAPTMSTKDPLYFPQRQFSKARNQWKIAYKNYTFALEEGEVPDPEDVLGYSFETQIKKYDNKFSDMMRDVRESGMSQEDKIITLKKLSDQRQLIRDQLVRQWKEQTGE